MKKPLTLAAALAAIAARFQSFDLLATLVAVVRTDGTVVFANAALEDALGTSRRTIEGSQLPDCFTEPHILQNALEGVQVNEWSGDTLRLTFDRVLTRRLPLALPADSVRRYTATFTPAAVTFRGPSSLVQALRSPYSVALPAPDKDGNVEIPLIAPAQMRVSAATVRVHLVRR